MAEESLHSYCFLVLREYFTITVTSPFVRIFSSSLMTDLKGCNITQIYLVVLLILLSGNVETNPGPDSPAQCLTPADFKPWSGLGIIHINVRSLLSKLDMIKIWINSASADIVVLSETEAPDAWNKLQSELHLQNLIPVTEFKALMKTVESRLSVCKCFIQVCFYVTNLFVVCFFFCLLIL